MFRPPSGISKAGVRELHPVRAAIDDGGRLDRVLHQFQAYPDAGKAAERDAVKPEIEDFLHARGAEHGAMRVDQRPVGLVAGGGAFARVVVAHGHKHAAMRRRAGHVHMAEHVAGAVHAGPLAVPEAEDAVELALAAQLGALAAPERGGGKVLVQAGLETRCRTRRDASSRGSSACRRPPTASRDSR